ncbi:MAG: NACHT domain-containing protein [Candidatus Thiodiazotropha lotti]|nr:NACHT domain-containing protein [Candidatus Thiodiazotropha lotti]MCW4189081.1 NACHT domain-containing protein [Candidatus Thiodiazotropha lotti]
MESKYQKKRLATINNEVKHLHPLLNDLFQKLPNICNIEYTHGTNEMGADFLLQKFDETLSEESWIGVIAKIGPIRQNNNDVERQIEECKIARYALGGKKNIYINEIWVITTGKISNNAKVKIHSKHNNSNVHFIDDNKLIKLIDTHISYFWHDVSHTLSSYLTKLSTKISNKEAEANILGDIGKNFYIELDIEKIIENPYERKSKVKNIDFDKEVLSQKLCLLEGEMGSGKSKVLRQIIKSTSCVESYVQNNVVPIYISYKDFQDLYNLDHLMCIEKELAFDRDQLNNDKVKYLLLIDSIDEAFDSHEESLEKIIELANNINLEDNIHAVFATRPMRSLAEETQLKKHFRQYRIKPLSVKKIKEFIEVICTELSLPSRIIDDINKSQLFKQIPHSPIAAILLSTLLAENAKDLPSNITELYAQAMEYMLGRWDIEKGLLTQKEYEASEALCGLISEYMLENTLTKFSAEEAKEIFNNYLNERNLSLNTNELFSKIIERSGVLARDSETNSIYFKHRSFAEFLYAKYKKRNNSLVVDPRIFDPYWSNIYFFYVGLHKDCPELLEEILGYPTSTESERWLKIINMPNYFLAAFSSPYRIVEDNLYKLFLEAAQFYHDVINSKTETALIDLPEIHILWIFQEIIASAYSFEFFLKSFDNTTICIDEQTTDESVKAYALYFLSAAAMDLNYDHPLEYLLKHYSINNLPISISLALQAESDLRKESGKSPLMKRHNKQLKSLIKKNQSVRSAVSDIVEKSTLLTHKKRKI